MSKPHRAPPHAPSQDAHNNQLVFAARSWSRLTDLHKNCWLPVTTLSKPQAYRRYLSLNLTPHPLLATTAHWRAYPNSEHRHSTLVPSFALAGQVLTITAPPISPALDPSTYFWSLALAETQPFDTPATNLPTLLDLAPAQTQVTLTLPNEPATWNLHMAAILPNLGSRPGAIATPTVSFSYP